MWPVCVLDLLRCKLIKWYNKAQRRLKIISWKYYNIGVSKFRLLDKNDAANSDGRISKTGDPYTITLEIFWYDHGSAR